MDQILEKLILANINGSFMIFKKMGLAWKIFFVPLSLKTTRNNPNSPFYKTLKVHKNENFFGFDFEFCPISLLVMHK